MHVSRRLALISARATLLPGLWALVPAAAAAQQVPYADGPPLVSAPAYYAPPAMPAGDARPARAATYASQQAYVQQYAAQLDQRRSGATAAYAQPSYRPPAYVQPAYAQPAYATPVATVTTAGAAPRSPVNAYDGGNADSAPVGGNRFEPGSLPRDGRGPKELETQITAGYRTGKLQWNIAGDAAGQNPNVLSELTWDKLRMAEIGAGARYLVPNGRFRRARLEGSGYYAHAVSGDNQDSDYEFDNRTNEFSRSNNDAKGSNAYGLKAAIGYEIPFVEQPRGWRLLGTPLLGFQYHQQHMRMRDGNQTICGGAPSLGFDCTGIPLGPFADLDSRYTAQWYGPFAGLEAELGYGEAHQFRLRGEYGYMTYRGDAQWNLRGDFRQDISFDHEADGEGGTLSAEYRYGWTGGTAFTLGAEIAAFKATDGTDRTFYADGTQGETRLNEVTWDSQSYRVGLEQNF